jgi:hypothetical protein
MLNPKKRCVVCHRWYEPDPRIGEDQLACGREECRKERKAEYDREWRKSNPGYGSGQKVKQQAWAKANPNYWRHYRKTHPDYVERERERMRSRREGLKSVAKQVLIRQIAVEKLRSIEAQAPKTVAKQVLIHRRMDGIVDYLFWKEGVAKQVSTDLALSP